jgi:hypothetical protein
MTILQMVLALFILFCALRVSEKPVRRRERSRR